MHKRGESKTRAGLQFAGSRDGRTIAVALSGLISRCGINTAGFVGFASCTRSYMLLQLPAYNLQWRERQRVKRCRWK